MINATIAIMLFSQEILYKNILLLCCFVDGPMPNNNDDNNNNNSYSNSGEDELQEVGSNRPACASCKHQRKKCMSGDCVMWRHFPASKMDEFLGVHKVFGISNVTKKIKSFDDVAQQDESIKSFLWEAKLWQEDPVHGPLGEYKKLEKQLMKEQRNKQLQIVQFPRVPQVPITTTSESTTSYVPHLAIDQHHRENGANHSQQDYNMLNSSVPNYANHFQWHGPQGVETQGITSNGSNLMNIGFGNDMFGYGNLPYRPIEQIRNGYIPMVHRQATYNNGGHVQLHEQRFPYNNVDLGLERRRKDQTDQFVHPNFNGRHVRGRGIGSIGPMIRHSPIISNCSSGSSVDSIIVNATGTMANHSVNGRHVEDGRNQRAQGVATVLQDFTNYNHNDLPGEHKQRDMVNRDHSTSK